MECFAAIDLYCERLDPGYWAEPLDALFDITFPLAAIWGFVARYVVVTVIQMTGNRTGSDNCVCCP